MKRKRIISIIALFLAACLLFACNKTGDTQNAETDASESIVLTTEPNDGTLPEGMPEPPEGWNGEGTPPAPPEGWNGEGRGRVAGRRDHGRG